MVETDYPHADSTWPDTQAVLSSTFAGLPPAELHRLASGNAARLFRHPPPPSEDWRAIPASGS